ncbi:MAG: iron(III) ABC transporter [Pseudomonas sp.]|uniref:ChaN family lipoprotein n=1 Tax=Pseudomonas sp. FEMGT703P TaxID=2080764 RepID=UPI000CC8CC4A|nr:ChaN family lipoprotein [Pseudomonas sp. FEMGT703P]PJE38843.1 MAG: iron(III) ABC transporter [Pseudomonas sp.] [Pseudomonas sp. FEMGT703P]
MRIALLLAAALLSACQAWLPALPAWQSPEGLQHPELGQIVELRTGARLTPEQLLTRLAAAPKVLVGERHDNPDHHSLQLWLLRALAAQRPQGSLLLEMLTPDQQVKVDQVRAAIAAGQVPQDILGALNWQPGWAWSLYGPLVQHALRQPYPLLAANLERREVMQIYAQVPQLQGQASTAQPVREALLEQIRQSHCNLLPESQLPAMLAVQQQRDRRMAEVLLAAPAPSLLFAGAFHVRRELGVPLHLQDLGAAEGVQVLILAEVGSQVDAESADYVWYTPAQPEQDHCAKLRP